MCWLCLCARLFICALWSPAGNGLASWLSFVVSAVSLSLSYWYPGQVWYLIVSIPDHCTLTYFDLSISTDIVSTKIYNKRDTIFRWWCSSLYILWSTYLSTHSFARASRHDAYFKTRNKLLTHKLLKQGYQYHKLHKTFSKFYRRYYN